MPVDYIAPQDDMRFVLQQLIDAQAIRQLPGYEEFSGDLVEAIIEEAGKFASGVISPLNSVSDEHGAKLLPGNLVKTSPGFKEAYQQYVEAGWNSLAGNIEHNGQGLPEVLATATNEMWHSASMSFALCPMLTAGAIHAIEHHGSASQKTIYLSKLISGEWAGTMNLTESQAGSDLAAVTTKAEPKDDHYLVSGTKIYITYGDHDLTDNIIHLVLARIPGAPAGVKDISLFIVPKFLVNADGSIGQRNDVHCISLEHKLGIHGSPTAVMSYGDQGGAIGYLVGEPNRGLEYMFTMMNHARLNVGLQGIAVAERALQQAKWYAYDRVQGKTLLIPPEGNAAPAPIAYHPDVRRMLASMDSRIQAMRALAYEAAAQLDIAARSPNLALAQAAQLRADFLIPIIKGWCTELSVDIASNGVQVHGGMGYVEETGAAQLLRDARITTIYEGTTAIQANDLLGRKLLRDQGACAGLLLNDMATTIALLDQTQDSDLKNLGANLKAGHDALKVCFDYMLNYGKTDAPAAYFGSVPLLMLAGHVLGGWMMARAALICHETDSKTSFALKKRASAYFYGQHVLLPALGLVAAITAGRQGIETGGALLIINN